MLDTVVIWLENCNTEGVGTITIILNLPEDIAKELSEQGADLTRAALESLVLEGYRSGRLSLRPLGV